MSASSEMNERHGRILAKLSELSLTLAVDLHTRALAAEDTDEVSELVNAYQKIARGVRQTMALEARLHRDAAIAAREIAAEDERTRPARVELVDYRQACDPQGNAMVTSCSMALLGRR